jgi:hypothetical protein
MEAEGALQRSEEPAIAFCPEAVQSSPHYFFKIHFNIIESLMPTSFSGLFPSKFQIKFLYAFFIPPLRAKYAAQLFFI